MKTMQVTYPIPNQEKTDSRSEFLSKANNCERYFDGFVGHRNTFRVWEELGEPTHVLVRNDGWSICFREQVLDRALSLYPETWETLIRFHEAD